MGPNLPGYHNRPRPSRGGIAMQLVFCGHNKGISTCGTLRLWQGNLKQSLLNEITAGILSQVAERDTFPLGRLMDGGIIQALKIELIPNHVLKSGIIIILGGEIHGCIPGRQVFQRITAAENSHIHVLGIPVRERDGLQNFTVFKYIISHFLQQVAVGAAYIRPLAAKVDLAQFHTALKDRVAYFPHTPGHFKTCQLGTAHEGLFANSRQGAV